MTDLPWGDQRSIKFTTNVGLITSHGKHGDNVSSAEWTHHVSYQPGLIAICLKPSEATCENILETKEFGVSLSSSDMNVFVSVAGNNSARNIDKVAVLKELGVEFYKAKHIKCLMVKNALLNIECKVIKEIELGDHIMFVGEVLDAVAEDTKEPLVYHNLKFFKLGEQLHKPEQKELDRIAKIIEK